MSTYGNFVVYPRKKWESHSDYAYRILRQNIMRFHMEPGELINEVELSALLQISRTPIHEALIKLRGERLVNVVPRKESKVSRIEISLVNDGVFLRNCIEPRIIRIVQGNLSPTCIKALLTNLDCQRTMIEAQNFFDYNAVDDEFHQILFDAAEKRHIFENLRQMSTHLDRIRSLVSIETGMESIEANYHEHRKLFEFIAFSVPLETDLDDYIAAHITRYQSKMNTYLQTHPTYFSFD